MSILDTGGQVYRWEVCKWWSFPFWNHCSGHTCFTPHVCFPGNLQLMNLQLHASCGTVIRPHNFRGSSSLKCSITDLGLNLKPLHNNPFLCIFNPLFLHTCFASHYISERYTKQLLFEKLKNKDQKVWAEGTNLQHNLEAGLESQNPLLIYRDCSALPCSLGMAFKSGGKNSHTIPEQEGN